MKALLPILVFFSAHVFAQQQAGDLAIQFSGNFFSQKYVIDNIPFRSLGGNIYVKLGKFFTPNLELGVKPNFIFSPDIKINQQDQTKNKTTVKMDVGFGMYAAYSILAANGKINPYGGAEVNYLPAGDEAFVNLGPYVGVRYFVTERINLDGNLNWLINLGSTYGNAIRQSGLEIRPAATINIGLGVILGKIL